MQLWLLSPPFPPPPSTSHPPVAKLVRSTRQLMLTLPKAPGDWPAQAAAPRSLLLPPPIDWSKLEAILPGEAGARVMNLSEMFSYEELMQQVSVFSAFDQH